MVNIGPRIIINGDRTIGDSLIGLGLQLLLKVRNLASFNKLEQFSLQQPVGNFGLIRASSFFGVDMIEITVPQIVVEEGKIEVVVEVIGEVLLVSFDSSNSGSEEITVSSYLVDEATGIISSIISSVIIYGRGFLHPRLVGTSSLASPYIDNVFYLPSLETRPINASGEIGEETDLKQI